MEEKEVLVKAEGVSKKFCKDLKTSLKYGVQDLFANFGRNNKAAVLREKEFWALKDINFELRRGECLGLIGHNGAGKSTLLKILNGLIKPDEGKVTIKGKVSALIELGAGFNPILSGRENIYNNGAVLGFTREEINNKVEEIIDFAEIREFIDMPVQNYSSGMKVRLGFAVAAQMEPDVLLIDEVLAVGDIGFRAKCYDSINTTFKNTAVIFVSHAMPQVARMCNIVLNMERGRCVYLGITSGGINKYNLSFTGEVSKAVVDRVILSEFLINDQKSNVTVNYGDDIELELTFLSNEFIKKPVLNIHIIDATQQYIYQINSNRDKVGLQDVKIGLNKYCVKLKEIQLNAGNYSFSIAFRDSTDREFYSWYHAIGNFTVNASFLGESQYQGKAQWSQ
jgi:lipopolysaccharide transport system ATP-binding protein